MSDDNSPSGDPKDEIAEPAKPSAKPSHDRPAVETVAAAIQPDVPADTNVDVQANQPSEPADAPTAAQTAQVTFAPLCLSPDQIAAPAFYVDKKLALLWMAPSGTDAISRALSLELKSTATRNIFNLLLRPAIKTALSDWQALFSFVYIILRRGTAKGTFDTATEFISRDHIPTSGEKIVPGPDIYPFQVDSRIIGRGDKSSGPPLRIFGLGFKHGTLFLLRQDLWHPATTDDRENESAFGNIRPVDEKKSICVLSARLNDAQRIADTMLPEVFFKWMNRIWDEADGVVKPLGGLRAGSRGAQINYLFTESAGRNPIFSAICSATRLNRQMQALAEKLRAKQGWADEICMNMGIGHGQDDLTGSDPTASMEFMIPGGAFDQSSHLSGLAGNGEIWITKNAVAQLPKKLTDQVVLGIDRQGRFFRNFFTRLVDLPPGIGPSQPKLDMGGLSIARILKIEKQGSDLPISNEV